MKSLGFLKVRKFSVFLGLLTLMNAPLTWANQNLISCLSGLDRISQVQNTFTVQSYSRESRYLLPVANQENRDSFYLISPNGSCRVSPPDAAPSQSLESSIYSAADPWTGQTIYFGAFYNTYPANMRNLVVQDNLPSICSTYSAYGAICPSTIGEFACGPSSSTQALTDGLLRIEVLMDNILPTLQTQFYSLAAQEMGPDFVQANRHDYRIILNSSRVYRTAMDLAIRTVESCRTLRGDIMTHLRNRRSANQYNDLIDNTVRNLQQSLLQ